MPAKPKKKKALGRKTLKRTRGGALAKVGGETPAAFASGDPDRPFVIGSVPNSTKP